MATEADVRKIALSLPDVTETRMGYRVGDRLFAAVHHRYGGPSLVLWCRDLDEKEIMLEARPGVFFTMPHYDGHASILVKLDALPRSDLRPLLEDAWRTRAPKKLLEKQP